MPIIEWGDWQAAQEAITNGNNALSGMKPPAAESALKFTKVTLKDGSAVYAANTVNAPPQSNWQLNFDTGSLEAYYEYVGEGGKVTSTGAATTGSNVKKSVNLAMTEKTGGLAGVGALLSVNLPTAAAAIAPVAGVALGAGLYSANPELWEKISRALLPFCYDDTELLPVVADESGNTYFPKEAVDAVSSVLKVENGLVGSDSSTAPGFPSTVNPFPFPFVITSYAEQTNVKPVWAEGKFAYTSVPVSFTNVIINIASSHSVDTYFASEVPFKIATVYKKNPSAEDYEDATAVTLNGKTFYAKEINGLFSFPLPESFPYTTTDYDSDYANYPHQISYIMLYGYSESYPVGVSKWSGVQYPLNPEGIGVVTRISPDGQLVTTAPYYPVTMPVGDPGVSPTPNEVPQPGTNIEVGPAVDPWLTPKPGKETYPEGQPESEPAKVTDPVPDTDPNLDPNANPSQVSEQQTETGTDTVQSTKPNDGGVSPNPQIPIVPVLPSAATGLLHVYNPTQPQLDAFGSWLWTTFSGDLIDTVSKLFNDPMDAVIGLHELYATPAVSGSSTIRAGFLDSGVSSNVVGSRYTTINCGSIVVQEYYQNYLDYSPYTKCYIYLPFVGIVSVLADDIIGNAVNVTYHVDSYTGCCIAVVTVAREGYSSTVYQFEGNCAVEIPITSGYQSTLMGALIGVGATALTGNPHAGIAAANMGRASLGKNDVSHSGSFGSSYGAMGAKVPYIIVKRPTQKSVVNYNQDYGFPAHKRVTIGACSGYLRAREVHVISPTATDEEKAKIEELLKSGVFVE